EWAQTDFAALAAGAVVTTVYASSSPSQLRYLLEDPEATVVVAENGEMLEDVLAVRDDLDHDLDAIVTVDEVDGDAVEADDLDDVYGLGEVH
ncbi:long-chain fatty acid--CoA ligase, partial [Halorubrum sp. SS5]